MKSFLFVFLIFIPSLHAQPNMIHHNWYVKGGVGLNYLTLEREKAEEIEMNTGLYSTLTVGYQFKENLHAEIEAALRKNTAYQATIENQNYVLTGDIYTYSGLLNLILDFPFEDLFVFSIGAGTGVQNTEGQLTYNTDKFNRPDYIHVLAIKNEGICVQGIMRLLVQFNKHFGVCTEYKYWKAPNFHQNNTLAASLKIDF